MSNFCSWRVLLAFLATAYLLPHFAAAESPDLVISLVRHGDRSPRVPLNEALWPMGNGELTVKGVQQCYELGKKLRQRYFSDDFPETWHSGYSRHIAKSLNRTIQSANAILQGFYPSGVAETGLPNQTQIPSLFAYPPESDFLFGAHHICPGFVKRMEALENSATWRQKKASYGARFSHWAKVANRPKQIFSLIPLIDAVFIRKLYNIPLPDDLTHADQEQLIGLLDWFFTELIKDKQMLQLLSANFIQELIDTLDGYQARSQARKPVRHQTCKGSHCERFVLYVASDLNLLTFLAIMGVPRTQNVGYGSHLDLIVSSSEARNPGVKWFLDDEPLVLTACQADCSLEQLISLLRKQLPENWQALCEFGSGVQLKGSRFQYYDHNSETTKEND